MGGKRRKIATNHRRETREQRSISFSKRRQGLYNKAAELCLFYGAQVAIVVSSPCSVNNLYSLGDSFVFEAFLQGRPPDDNAPSAEAVSLYEEMKAPENERKSDVFWREIEVLEKRCESVEGLQALVDNLEKFKDKALNRLVMSIISDSPSWSNLSNSACLEEKHADENLAFSDSINFDENYVGDVVELQAGCGMVTDSTSHTVDKDVFCSFIDINPHHKHSTCETVSEFGPLTSRLDQLVSYDDHQRI